MNETTFDHVEPEREISHIQGKKGKCITIVTICWKKRTFMMYKLIYNNKYIIIIINRGVYKLFFLKKM